MARKRNTFALGLALLVMFSVFVGFLLFIGAKGVFPPKTHEFVARFGLGAAMPEIVPGSRVNCFGQAVGKVIETKFVEAPDPTGRSSEDLPYLEVRATALTVLNLRSDCKIVSTGPPLGGKGIIEIVACGISDQPLTDKTVLYGSVTGFQEVLATVTRELDEKNSKGLLRMLKREFDAGDKNSLLARVRASSMDINRITKNLALEMSRDKEGHLLAKLHESMDKVNLGLAELVALLEETRPPLGRTIASAESAMSRIDREVVTRLSEEFDPEHKGGLLAHVHTAFEKLNASLDDLNVITTSGKGVVVLNSARIDELVQNASEAGMLLRGGIKDLTLHPWKLLSKPTPSEMRELNTFNVAREFAEASAHLDDSTSRLKAMIDMHGSSIDTNDVQLQNIQADLADSVAKYREAEQALWKLLNK
ncbi:MAG: hypothetical protein GXP29_08510 [Planctomycetes bacterium]|nr:hypothetical protein [Planctomycetota bacterium]